MSEFRLLPFSRFLPAAGHYKYGVNWFWRSGISGQFGFDVLAFRASLILSFWPFGPVWFRRSSLSGQFGFDVLAFRASLILMFWPFGPVWFCHSGILCQFGFDVLAFRTSLILVWWPSGQYLYFWVGFFTFWPFGPISFWRSALLGQFYFGFLLLGPVLSEHFKSSFTCNQSKRVHPLVIVLLRPCGRVHCQSMPVFLPCLHSFSRHRTR